MTVASSTGCSGLQMIITTSGGKMKLAAVTSFDFSNPTFNIAEMVDDYAVGIVSLMDEDLTLYRLADIKFRKTTFNAEEQPGEV